MSIKFKGPTRGRMHSSRYHKPFASDRRQFLTLKQMAEMKESEASVNARQKHEGTKHPTTAIGGKIVKRCSYETTSQAGYTYTNWRYLVEKRDYSRPRHYGVAYKCEWFAEWDLENRLKEEDYNKRKHRR